MKRCCVTPHISLCRDMHPDKLNGVAKPWYDNLLETGSREGPFGEIMPEDEFYGWLKAADDFDLLWLDPDFLKDIREKFTSHPFVTEAWHKKVDAGKPMEKIREIVDQDAALPVFFQRQAGRLDSSGS